MTYVFFLLIGTLIFETLWAFVFGISNNLNKCIKTTIAGIIIAGAGVLLSGSKIDAPERYTLYETRTALEYVIDHQIPQLKPEDVNASLQSKAFFEAQNTFDVPSFMLITIGYYESKYLINAIGDAGRSVGIMQVGPKGRRRCVEYCGDMTTEYQQIMCGGCWLRENINWCGSFERGVTGYACGRCKSKYARTQNAVQRRFEMWYNLDRKVRKLLTR